jgi:SAM-dependent methyltransferase
MAATAKVRTLRSWAVDHPITSPFALPDGWPGRLAGRFMLWTNRQDELVDVLDLRPGQRVLEVGYGPGGLIRLLARRAERLQVIGVDPAAAMRDLASRTNRAAVRDGRVELRLGTADDTGLDDASVDRVVSVNNVGLWPDLDAGVRELHRVVRPGGTVVLAWHGGTAPSRITRRLRLPADKLDRIEASLGRRFDSVTRRQLRGLDVFVAT